MITNYELITEAYDIHELAEFIADLVLDEGFHHRMPWNDLIRKECDECFVEYGGDTPCEIMFGSCPHHMTDLSGVIESWLRSEVE